MTTSMISAICGFLLGTFFASILSIIIGNPFARFIQKRKHRKDQ